MILASSVSREHAELRKTDAGWHVRDLGSRNGTFLGTFASGGGLDRPQAITFGPDGNLYVVSLTKGTVFEVFRKSPQGRSGPNRGPR